MIMRLSNILWIVFILSGKGCAPAKDTSQAESQLLKIQPLSRNIIEYLDAAIDTLKRVSRHRETVNWPVIRDSAIALSVGAWEPRDVYPVIDWLLSRVDPHSFLQANWFGVRGDVIENKFGYIRVPFYGGGMESALADSLQNIIRRLDSQGVCGWVIDLRSNGGGNVWPMLAGIGPLLADSVVGWDQTPTGRMLRVYSNGAAILIGENGSPMELVRVAVEPYTVQSPDAPVAVLIDNGTASSGEAIAICFRGRPNTRFFGQRSAGMSTTNTGYRLPDGKNMVITVGVYADRSGVLYEHGLDPDESIDTPLRGPTLLIGDPVVFRALEWLGNYCNSK